MICNPHVFSSEPDNREDLPLRPWNTTRNALPQCSTHTSERSWKNPPHHLMITYRPPTVYMQEILLFIPHRMPVTKNKPIRPRYRLNLLIIGIIMTQRGPVRFQNSIHSWEWFSVASPWCLLALVTLTVYDQLWNVNVLKIVDTWTTWLTFIHPPLPPPVLLNIFTGCWEMVLSTAVSLTHLNKNINAHKAQLSLWGIQSSMIIIIINNVS